MHKFTVFCTDEEKGTIWIQTVEVKDHNAQDAAIAGRRLCADAWCCQESSVKVLGVADGEIEIAMWSDEGLELPTPQQLLSILIDFDAWPGAPFTGGKIIEIDRGVFNDSIQFRDAIMSEVQPLLDGLAEDDASGDMAQQILSAAYDVLDSWEAHGKDQLRSLVLSSGRYKLDGDGDPELYSGTSSPVFDEQFDISVSIIPVLGEEPEDDEEA